MIKIENDKFSATESFDPFALHVNISEEISNLDEKIVPGDDDVFVIEDSEDTYFKKKILFKNIGSIIDTNAIHKNQSSEIQNIALKTNIVKNDILLIEDSENSFNKKHIKTDWNTSIDLLNKNFDVDRPKVGVFEDFPTGFLIDGYTFGNTINDISQSLGFTIGTGSIVDGGLQKTTIVSFRTTNPPGSGIIIPTSDTDVIGGYRVTSFYKTGISCYIIEQTIQHAEKFIICFPYDNISSYSRYSIGTMSSVIENPYSVKWSPKKQAVLIGTGDPVTKTCRILRGLTDTWTEVYSNPTGGIIYDIIQVGSQSALAVMTNTNITTILKTIDDGLTWEQFGDLHPFEFKRLIIMGKGQILALTDKSIYESNDWGLTFNSTPILTVVSPTFKSMAYIGYGITIVCGGDAGTSSDYWITYNRGCTWEHYTINGSIGQNKGITWNDYNEAIVLSGTDQIDGKIYYISITQRS